MDNNLLDLLIIHQTHHEKSDWSRAFNQFTIACELDMINDVWFTLGSEDERENIGIAGHLVFLILLDFS